MVKDAEIREVLRQRGNAAEIASRLVDLANEKGGRDNISVIVAHISPTMAYMAAHFFRRHWRKILWTTVTLLFGAACVAAGYFAHAYGL
jgi:serine/threonine protein phosphatase PrpC